MKFLIIAIMISSTVFADSTVKIALIDTGVYPLNESIKKKVVNLDEKVTSYHGTDLACILSKNSNIDTIYSYNHNNSFDDRISYLKDAIRKKVDYILYASSGKEYSKKEYYLMKIAEKRGINIIVSSGNSALNLDETKSFPCSYDLKNITCIGNKEVYSNYGEGVIRIEEDNDIDCLNTLKGTSQSAAIYLKNLIKN